MYENVNFRFKKNYGTEKVSNSEKREKELFVGQTHSNINVNISIRMYYFKPNSFVSASNDNIYF